MFLTRLAELTEGTGIRISDDFEIHDIELGDEDSHPSTVTSFSWDPDLIGYTASIYQYADDLTLSEYETYLEEESDTEAIEL